MEPIKILFLTDNLLTTTGFANASRPFCLGFHEAGFKVSVLGRLGSMPDTEGKYPFPVYPTSPMDHLGHMTLRPILQKEKPDILWVMDSPGNLARTMIDVMEYRKALGMNFKVIAYSPVEGDPPDRSFNDGYMAVTETGGINVLWTKYARKVVWDYFGLNCKYIYFGMDNEDMYPYTPDDRALLRRVAGLDDVFVVGTVGINKRTKGHTDVIKVARTLQDYKKIVFYIHTDPIRSTMHGHDLEWLADGLPNVIFPPDDNVRDRLGYWSGTHRSGESANALRKLEDPARGPLAFGNYSFVDRMNCLDLYLDLSQVEGWGLPVAEAMACGIPVLGVKDYAVRDEIFGDSRIEIEPLPRRMWDTWHTSADLVKADSDIVASRIVELYEDREQLADASRRGLENVKKYKWEDAVRKMIELVRSVYDS